MLAGSLLDSDLTFECAEFLADCRPSVQSLGIRLRPEICPNLPLKGDSHTTDGSPATLLGKARMVSQNPVVWLICLVIDEFFNTLGVFAGHHLVRSDQGQMASSVTFVAIDSFGARILSQLTQDGSTCARKVTQVRACDAY